MKYTNILKILFSLISIFILTACKTTNDNIDQSVEASTLENHISNVDENSKILVVYFSQTGTTEKIALHIANTLDTDIFEIVPKIPYTQDDLNYNISSTRATREQNNPPARPEILNEIDNLDNYDTIILGYPIWHGQTPKIVYTFLETYDFSDKTIFPFCTSHSSGVGSSASNLKNIVSSLTKWSEAKRFANQPSLKTIVEWLNS